MGERIGPAVMLFVFCGLCGPIGILVFIGIALVWAAFRILKTVAKLFCRPRRVTLGPKCPHCQTSLKPVTCMTCGPARVPDYPPAAWA